MTQKDIKDFAKTLLRESDSKIQLMYGTNIKLFDKPEYKTLLVNCLKNQSITRDQLKITPSRLKQFDRGLFQPSPQIVFAKEGKAMKAKMKELMLANNHQ